MSVQCFSTSPAISQCTQQNRPQTEHLISEHLRTSMSICDRFLRVQSSFIAISLVLVWSTVKSNTVLILTCDLSYNKNNKHFVHIVWNGKVRFFFHILVSKCHVWDTLNTNYMSADQWIKASTMAPCTWKRQIPFISFYFLWIISYNNHSGHLEMISKICDLENLIMLMSLLSSLWNVWQTAREAENMHRVWDLFKSWQSSWHISRYIISAMSHC